MKLVSFKILWIVLTFPIFTCKVNSEKTVNIRLKNIHVSRGIACWYGKSFEGKKTASGEIFNKSKLTAAHRFLEFGTVVRVNNLKNNKNVKVIINDRGPYTKDRILDLSEKAASEIGINLQGTGLVDIEICGYYKVNFETLIKHFNNLVAINKIKYKND